MSSSYVRQKVRKWCAEVSAVTGIPFYDTVNVSVTPSDPVWFTAIFVSEMHEGNFCKPQFIEHGFINLIFIARPGVGDKACLDAVEGIVPLLFEHGDKNLTLINYEPVEEDSGGLADKDYRMSVAMNYRLSL
jgi:hypothetical protein